MSYWETQDLGSGSESDQERGKSQTILKTLENSTRHIQTGELGTTRAPSAAPLPVPASSADSQSYSATACRPSVSQNFGETNFLVPPNLCTSTGEDFDAIPENFSEGSDSEDSIANLARKNPFPNIVVTGSKRGPTFPGPGDQFFVPLQRVEKPHRPSYNVHVVQWETAPDTEEDEPVSERIDQQRVRNFQQDRDATRAHPRTATYPIPTNQGHQDLVIPAALFSGSPTGREPPFSTGTPNLQGHPTREEHIHSTLSTRDESGHTRAESPREYIIVSESNTPVHSPQPLGSNIHLSDSSQPTGNSSRPAGDSSRPEGNSFQRPENENDQDVI